MPILSVGEATESSYTVGTTSVTVAARNLGRASLTIANDGAVAVYVSWSATASATKFTAKIAAGGLYELPLMGGDTLRPYAGPVSAITAEDTTTVRVTEV